MGEFITKVNPIGVRKYWRKIIFLTFIVLVTVIIILAIALKNLFLLLIFLPVLIAVSFIMYYNFIKQMGNIDIKFCGDEIYINNGIEVRHYYDLSRNDIVIEQSADEKTVDCCTLLIRKHNIMYSYVEDCSCLSEYINTHFNII